MRTVCRHLKCRTYLVSAVGNASGQAGLARNQADEEVHTGRSCQYKLCYLSLVRGDLAFAAATFASFFAFNFSHLTSQLIIFPGLPSP